MYFFELNLVAALVPFTFDNIMSKRYQSLGVSAGKEDVHHAIRNLDKGLFERAFCKVLPDYVGSDLDFVNFIHADTAGTKTSLAYLDWKESNDFSVWERIAQDALVMNLDDLACVGCFDDIIISSTIGRNKHLIPGKVIEHIILGTESFIAKMKDFGIQIYSGGGETADVGDIVRTIDVGITAFGRLPKKDLVINQISDGDLIVGLASFGQSIYESNYNSGIGSNGLTAARHDVLKKDYSLTEESYAPQTEKDYIYTGSYKLSDQFVFSNTSYRVGDLLLSPTRTYLPLLRSFVKNHRDAIHGIIHCTGGAQTKVKKFIDPLRIVKNNLFRIPPVFELIRSQSLCSPQEMYEVYNMGHRMEVYSNAASAEALIKLAAEFNIEARIIGFVEKAAQPEVLIQSELGEFLYN